MDQQQQYIPKRKDHVHLREDETIQPETWVVIATQDTGQRHDGQRIWVWIQQAEKAGTGPGEIVPSHQLLPIDY